MNTSQNNSAHNSEQNTTTSTSLNSQPANTNAEFEQINLSHRLVDTDMSCTVALVDNVTSATDKAISILSLIAGGIYGNVSKVEEARYFALDAVIDLLKDVDAIVNAHHEAIVGGAK